MNNIPASVLALYDKMDPIDFGKMIAAIITECGNQANTLESPKVVEKSLSKEELAPAEVRIVSAEVKPASVESTPLKEELASADNVKTVSPEVKLAPADVSSAPAEVSSALAEIKLAPPKIESVAPKAAVKPTSAEDKKKADNNVAFDELIDTVKTSFSATIPASKRPVKHFHQIEWFEGCCSFGFMCFEKRECEARKGLLHVSLPFMGKGSNFVPRDCKVEQEKGKCYKHGCCCLHINPREKPTCVNSDKDFCIFASAEYTKQKSKPNPEDLSSQQICDRLTHYDTHDCKAKVFQICVNHKKDCPHRKEKSHRKNFICDE